MRLEHDVVHRLGRHVEGIRQEQAQRPAAAVWRSTRRSASITVPCLPGFLRGRGVQNTAEERIHLDLESDDV